VDGKILAGKLISLLQDDARLQEMSRRNRDFLNQDALAHIERLICDGDAGMEAPTQAFELESINDPLPGNRALLALLERAFEKHRAAYKPELVIPRPQDLEYLKTRASALLIHPSWQERTSALN